ncbi:MAG: SIS domain-containing protein [Rhodobacter sp.]|nr:SIS domain-containing protein [Rhodobacter sp.]
MDQEKATAADLINAVQAEIGSVFGRVKEESYTSFPRLFSDPDRRLFFSGQGRSGLIAQMAAMRFMHLGFNAHFVGEATAPAIQKGDTLIVISGSGTTPVTVHFARIANRVGAIVGTVTSDAQSELALLADVVLCLPTDHTRQFGGSLFEQSSLILLDGLISHLAAGSEFSSVASRHTNFQ